MKNYRSSRFIRVLLPAALLVPAIYATGLHAADQARSSADSFHTFFVTRSLTHDRLLPYIETARPEIVQIGNYGAMFHGYADDKRSTGWPMQLPVAGEREALKYQRELNEKVHDLGLKVVGHFRLIKVMCDWQDRNGFVEYYDKRWPQDLLGPKPHPDVAELLQRDVNGEPIQLGRYGRGQVALCLSSPHAQQALKAMLKVAIENGVDGVNTNFNYHFGCACPHCQDAFKAWLRTRLTPEELRSKLAVDNLDDHTFETIPARIPGYPDAETATELDWLAARWGAEHFKRKFDEIFLEYGRSLKKDLIVAQWNHLGHVGLNEERMFLPADQWGRGEDYFWYSGGASFVGKNHNLAEGKAGDAWLSCLYVRELGDGKPFVIGKYDRTRLAVSMAEGFATGGIGMGRYMRFEEPAGFEVLARHTKFVHAHRDLYGNTTAYADAALVLPRQSVWNRRRESLDEFRELGQALVERQTLIDVVADEKISPERLQRYPAVILPQVVSLTDDQLAALRHYAAAGGTVLVRGDVGTMDESGRARDDAGIDGAVVIKGESAVDAAEAIESRIRGLGGTVIDAPWTVRATAYSQPQRTILHLVNYNREQGAPGNNRTGPETERPLAVEDIAVQMKLPGGRQARSVTLHAPDRDETITLKHQHQAGRVTFRVPRVLVYGVVEIETDQKPAAE